MNINRGVGVGFVYGGEGGRRLATSSLYLVLVDHIKLTYELQFCCFTLKSVFECFLLEYDDFQVCYGE